MRLRLLSLLLGVLLLAAPAQAATPFYVSDSFTYAFQDFATTGAWHFTGPANMEHAWGTGQPVTVEALGTELGFVAYADSLAGVNADVYMCLYDLGNVVSGIAQPVLVGGQPVILKYLTSGGAAMGDGLLINGVHRAGQYSRAGRALVDPIRLGGVTTPATGGPFQVGSLFRFFGSVPQNTALAYQYFLQGRVLDTVPPPPAGTAGAFLAFVDAGALTAGQTKYTAAWAGSTSEGDVYTQIIVPRAGTVKSLRVKSQVAPGSGQTHTFTVRKNGVDTGLSVVLSGSAVSGADLVTEVAVAAGDIVTMKEVASASAATTTVTASVEVQ